MALSDLKPTSNRNTILRHYDRALKFFTELYADSTILADFFSEVIRHIRSAAKKPKTLIENDLFISEGAKAETLSDIEAIIEAISAEEGADEALEDILAARRLVVRMDVEGDEAADVELP